MTRYLKLWWAFFGFSLTRVLQFRADFLFRIVMDCVFYGTSLAFFKVIFGHVDRLGDWTESQAMVFVSGFFIVDALQMVLVSPNIWRLPLAVNTGAIDYDLVRPVSSLFMLGFREVAVSSIVNLVIAVGLLFYYGQALVPAWEWYQYLAFLLLLMVGFTVHFSMQVAFTVPVFWLHSVDGIRGIFWSSGSLAERPDRIYPGWLRLVLRTVIPFALMASVPAEVMFSPEPWWPLLQLLLMTTVYFAVVIWVWSRGLRAYSSASS